MSLLRALGGYSAVIHDSIDHVFAGQSDNPRGARSRQHLVDRVEIRVPEIREQIQVMLGRLPVEAMNSGSGHGGEPHTRGPLGYGSHFEVELHAPSLGWVGVADYIKLSDSRCEIVDFKTGDASDEHKSQVRIYVLLWAHDHELNPHGRQVDKLTLSYGEKEVDIPPPSPAELEALERQIKDRTEGILKALTAPVPQAKASRQNCGFCDVRHLCTDYWIPATQQRLAGEAPTHTPYCDVEMKMTAQQSANTWKGIVLCSAFLPPGTKAVLQIAPSHAAFDEVLRVTDQARILDAHIVPPFEDGAPAIITMSDSSEGFLVKG